jgi:hypothetical protein
MLKPLPNPRESISSLVVVDPASDSEPLKDMVEEALAYLKSKRVI